jgi:hypothetical protein
VGFFEFAIAVRAHHLWFFVCVAMPVDTNPFDEFKDDSGTSSGEDEQPQQKLPPIKVRIPIL